MQLHPIVALGSTTAIVLAPAYALWLYHKISYGSFTNYIPRIYQDITTKEVQLLLPLLILTMWLGINPNILFNDISLPILGILANLPVMGIRSFSTDRINSNSTGPGSAGATTDSSDSEVRIIPSYGPISRGRRRRSTKIRF